MKRLENSILLFCLSTLMVLLLLSYSVNAQENISRTQLEDLHNQLEYNKTKKALVPRQFEKKRKEQENNDEQENIQLNWSGGGKGLNIIGYTIGGILALILIYLIVRSISLSRSDKEEEEVDLENLESIDEHDFQSLLDQKLQEKDFRTAIRIQFLTILQLLSKQRLIEWKRNKTNVQYTYEVKDVEVNGKFRLIANAFDILWYGNEEISEEQYELIANRTDELASFLSLNESV